MQSRIAEGFQQVGDVFVNRNLLAVFVVVSVFVGMPSAFAADDYLSELEAEAESSASIPDQDHPDAVQSGVVAPDSAQGRRLAFERALRAGRPSIYTFYGRLPDADKAQVVERYDDNVSNMSKAVNLTLDLYFKRK